jgi:hypothetical protein
MHFGGKVLTVLVLRLDMLLCTRLHQLCGCRCVSSSPHTLGQVALDVIFGMLCALL